MTICEERAKNNRWIQQVQGEERASPIEERAVEDSPPSTRAIRDSRGLSLNVRGEKWEELGTVVLVEVAVGTIDVRRSGLLCVWSGQHLGRFHWTL